MVSWTSREELDARAKGGGTLYDAYLEISEFLEADDNALADSSIVYERWGIKWEELGEASMQIAQGFMSEAKDELPSESGSAALDKLDPTVIATLVALAVLSGITFTERKESKEAE
jgi:hypothetical protein